MNKASVIVAIGILDEEFTVKTNVYKFQSAVKYVTKACQNIIEDPDNPYRESFMQIKHRLNILNNALRLLVAQGDEYLQTNVTRVEAARQELNDTWTSEGMKMRSN